MNILTAIIRTTFRSIFLYNLLNKIMINKAMQQQENKKEPVVDLDLVIRENNLELIEAEFFRQKKNVSRVKDAKGNRFILKTGRIDPFQIQLLKTAKLIENKLYFKVPTIIRQGEGWILMTEIEGQPLNEFYNEKPDWCAEVSKKVADSYQLVVQEMKKSQSFGDLLAEGQEWLYSRLNLWSKPIVDAGLIDFSLVQKLKTDFEEVIARKGEDFFDWAHGNIIGDHVIVSGEDIYLIDLNAVPRAGKGYHDFLRALDFMFLNASNEEQIFSLIPKWIKQYLSEFDEDEVKLVFAFRSIGILGWDMLHEGDLGKGDFETKKELLLRFIRRDY